MKFNRLGPLLLALPLGACGFHPMYGGENGMMAETLSTIYVEPMQDRIGYELRNSMIDLLNGPGSPSGATYRLTLSLTQTTQAVALQNGSQNDAQDVTSDAITRYNDMLKIAYVLTDFKGHVVTQGVETGLSDYNVLPSFAPSPGNPGGSTIANYGTLAAQQDAEKRSAEDIAQRIELDLNVYFSKRPKS